MKIQKRIQANIDLDAIAYNLENMKKNLKKGTQIIAVLKADGYGHGAVPLAKEIESYPYIWGIAVATVEEGMELRQAGIQKPILILGYTYEEDYDRIVREDFRPTVFKLSMAEKLSRAATRAGKTLKIHIKIDTGMTRIGYRSPQEDIPEIVKISRLPGLEAEGIFTHFARADENDVFPAARQLEKFLKFLAGLEKAGVTFPLRHCSNSAGIIRMPDANLDAVRAGIILYGLYPSEEVEKEPVPLKAAMELKSHIAYIKTVEPGVEISYGGTFTTTEPTKVATIPVGYADGYSRGLSNKGSVLIRGRRAPILGRVCMDQFMVDVTHIPEAAELDEVTLLGKDGEDCITMEELGNLSGRFNYEFACCISKRVPRVYYKNGQVQE
ncbi:MAG TPA: alanine racemase [Candidatus Blautia stercoravium]|nr:alanine racemase [Candidatus Blautia stercoravium]